MAKIRLHIEPTSVLTACLLSLSAAVCQQDQPARLTLAEALARAKVNDANFASVTAAEQTAKIDASLATTSLLPSVIYHNQVLYTQPNGQVNQGGQVGAQASPVFIANNAVREYASQASISETIGLRQIADARIASANAARAAAELEVTRRGLVATVVSLYYAVSTSGRKQALLARAFSEAESFTTTTEQREAAREVAHADVLKALLTQQQRQRDLSDAEAAAQKAKLELATLVFPDPRTPYVTDVVSSTSALPSRDDINRLAADRNPEIRSALANFAAANATVTSARAAYLPDLALNFTYGIDAPQFARRGPEDVRNLGYSLSGTLDIPVWDWFSTQRRIRQSQIQRDAARRTLTAAQRRLIADLEETYTEAATAHDQLSLLDQSADTAQDSLRLTKLRYLAGEATALEVVDAQNSFLAAGTAQVDGQLRYEASLAALQVLTGIL